jgi:hypothetical protein
MEKAQIDAEVKRLASLLLGCGRFGESFRRDQGRYPREDSLLGQQQRDPDFDHHCKEVFNLAVVGHVATEDYLAGMGHLFGPPPVTVFTQQVALRSAVEVSARASYLMDEAIDPRERAARYLNERIENLTRNARMQRATGEDPADTLKRLDKVWKQAQGFGFQILTDKRGKNASIEFARPNATNLIGKLFANVDESMGQIVYGHFSSVSHGTLVGLLYSFDLPDEVDTKGNRVAAGQVTTQDLALQFTIASLAWAISFDRTVYVCGWDSGLWQSWRRQITDAIERVFTPPKTEGT